MSKMLSTGLQELTWTVMVDFGGAQATSRTSQRTA